MPNYKKAQVVGSIKAKNYKDAPDHCILNFSGWLLHIDVADGHGSIVGITGIPAGTQAELYHDFAVEIQPA